MVNQLVSERPCASQGVQAAQPQPVEDLEADLSFEPAPKRDYVPLKFDDPNAAYQSKSNFDILRTIAVLSGCQFRPLVLSLNFVCIALCAAYGPFSMGCGLR